MYWNAACKRVLLDIRCTWSGTAVLTMYHAHRKARPQSLAAPAAVLPKMYSQARMQYSVPPIAMQRASGNPDSTLQRQSLANSESSASGSSESGWADPPSRAPTRGWVKVGAMASISAKDMGARNGANINEKTSLSTAAWACARG
jgi:hypothetical protein